MLVLATRERCSASAGSLLPCTAAPTPPRTRCRPQAGLNFPGAGYEADAALLDLLQELPSVQDTAK